MLAQRHSQDHFSSYTYHSLRWKESEKRKKKIKFDKNSYGKTKKTTVLKLAGPNSVFIALHMGRILAKSLIKPP